MGISDIAEGFAFGYVGMSVFAYWDATPETRNVAFTFYMLMVVVASRFLTIPLLSTAAHSLQVMRCSSLVGTWGDAVFKLFQHTSCELWLWEGS